jgi:hypothetical protein
MDEIRTQVTMDGVHTLFLGCVAISDLDGNAPQLSSLLASA